MPPSLGSCLVNDGNSLDGSGLLSFSVTILILIYISTEWNSKRIVKMFFSLVNMFSGGSVMVQIFGGSGKESRGSSESGEKEKESSSNRKKKLEKTVAASPVMVRSSGDKYNNVMDRYK